jgi:hypothetical protein
MNKYEINMKIEKLNSLVGKNILVFIRYGFKKKTEEETQSYKGILINSDDNGIIIKRIVDDGSDNIEFDFFPWHNIDAIRFRPE